MIQAPPPITVAHLHKSYRRGATTTPVLRDVSLQVERGECVFLAGPSGSGKTTLLSILGCILTPDEGRVEILGCDLGGLNASSRADLRRNAIGFLFQKFHLIRGLNAQENVAVPLTLQGARPGAARRKAAELLAAVGLAEHLRRDPRQMSVGQCQRIALARALAGDPQLIMADEPTASLDPDNGAAILQIIRDLVHQQGRTAIIVTHDARIYRFADRILHLENGTLLAEQRPEPTHPLENRPQRAVAAAPQTRGASPT